MAAPVDGPYLTSLLGCKHECKRATQAMEVGRKSERGEAGFLTAPSRVPFNLSRLNAAGASPRGRSEGSTDASPPGPKHGGPVRAGASPSAAVLTACAPTNSPSAPLKVPALPPSLPPSSCLLPPPLSTHTRAHAHTQKCEGDVVARASVHDFFCCCCFYFYLFINICT